MVQQATPVDAPQDDAVAAIGEAQKAIEDAKEAGNDVSRAENMLKIARMFFQKGNIRKAMDYADKVVDLLK